MVKNVRLTMMTGITSALVGCSAASPPTPVVAPVVAAYPYEGSQFDGSYVGESKSTGVCTDPLREMVIVVKRGQARMVWEMRAGRELLGEVSPTGDVEMHSQHETYLVDLKGRIEGDILHATTSSTSSHGDCTYELTLRRRDLSKAS